MAQGWVCVYDGSPLCGVSFMRIIVCMCRHLMGAMSPNGNDTDNLKGILQGHCYTIIRAVDLDGYELLQLRNPHAKTEWEGAWADDDSDHWTRFPDTNVTV